MPFSGSQVTRLGHIGIPRGLTGSFAGKAIVPPVFAGTIPDISVNASSGTHEYDYSSYFTGATSYSISPAVETGWTFNTSTCVLTIDTDDSSTFGPYTITGTNAGGSDSSNAFSVTVSSAFSGGFLYDMEQVRYHVRRFKAEDEEEKEAKPILEDIAERIEQDSTVKDIEIVLRMRLRLQGLKYKSLYLKWLKTEARRKKQIIREAVAEMEAKQRRKRKRQEEEIILLFMH